MDKTDIIFTEPNNQEIALEIETGINLKKNKNRLLEKRRRRRNNQIYGSNWYFVPYHSRDAKSYAKYGKTIRRTKIKTLLKEVFKNYNNYS